MAKTVRVQTSLDQQDLSGNGDFAALFAQLDSPAAVAPIEGGLMRLLGSINTFRQDRNGKR